jgi:sterol desaturase/sphingolipid hydroxylase (fatty acid hydroxylase superfamily)
MVQIAVILGAAALFIALERIRPGRELPNPAGWYGRAVLLNAVQLGVVVLAGLTWNRWFSSVAVLGISAYMPPLGQGALAWFVGTFVFYWWHRLRHHSDLMWRVFHQVHHSAARIEAITSFYKHPLEIAINSLLASAIIFLLLGGSLEGAAWFNVFAAVGEMFYHSNVRTPKWVGYFMQRPEHHSIHHEVDVHNFNFGDITWWDRLFGTFRDALDFAPACGFPNDAERQLVPMLMFKDSYNVDIRDSGGRLTPS